MLRLRYSPLRIVMAQQSQLSRLQELAKIHDDIEYMLRAGSEVISELSKPFPAPEVTQVKSQEFLSQLRKIHDSLSHQIAYLSKVGSSAAHNSSIYGLEKDYELSVQELDVVRSKVNSLLQSSQKTHANGHIQ